MCDSHFGQSWESSHGGRALRNVGLRAQKFDRERRINKEITVLLLRALVMSTRECRQT